MNRQLASLDAVFESGLGDEPVAQLRPLLVAFKKRGFPAVSRAFCSPSSSSGDEVDA